MDPTPVRARSVIYLAATAGAGAAVLGLEVLAARTMAPVLGTGSVAWAALLAVALGSLAAGNLAGGALADRSVWRVALRDLRPGSAVTWSLVAAALATAVLSQVGAPLMRLAGDLPLLPGCLAAAAMAQLVPLALLGAVTPMLLKARGSAVGGAWAGAVLASGSAGGIAGALATGLWLLPAVGIGRSYLVLAAVLALAAALVAVGERRWRAAAAAAGAMALVPALWLRAGDDAAVESPYGRIEVRTLDGSRVLFVDGLPQTAARGSCPPWEALRSGYLLEAALLAAGPARPRSALVIGLGGGLAPRILAAHGIPCESVEIDPEVIRAARREFGFDGPVTVDDGRRFLERHPGRWDLIVLDVCTGERLAFHLFTREALEAARRRLAPGGSVAVQFIGDDGPWSAAVLRTAEGVFGRCALVRPRAEVGPVGPRWLLAGPAAGVPEDARAPWEVVRPAAPDLARSDILTDDRFPAERAWAEAAALWRRTHGLRD